MYIGKHANLISLYALEIEEALEEMQVEETIAEFVEIIAESVKPMRKVSVNHADFSITALMRTYGADRKPVQHGCGNYCYAIRRGGMRGCGDRKPVGILR